MGWVANATPLPLSPRERPGTHFIGGGVGPRVSLGGCRKSRPLAGFDSDRPACSESQNRLCYPGLSLWKTTHNKIFLEDPARTSMERIWKPFVMSPNVEIRVVNYILIVHSSRRVKWLVGIGGTSLGKDTSFHWGHHKIYQSVEHWQQTEFCSVTSMTRWRICWQNWI